MKEKTEGTQVKRNRWHFIYQTFNLIHLLEAEKKEFIDNGRLTDFGNKYTESYSMILTASSLSPTLMNYSIWFLSMY